VDIVSVFRSKPAMRWLVPAAAAVAVIGSGAAAGTIVASADSSLPERSAAQLLVDIQSAKVDGLSGTVVESADLGLPVISNMKGSGNADLSSLIAGSNTAKVWYAGDQKVRLALLGTQGEADLIRNGPDAWLWSSAEKTATHFTIPAGVAEHQPKSLSEIMPKTPQEAADAALAAVDPTTKVTTTGAAKVAGRDAYELVLSPKDTASLIGQVRLAIDAEHHIPLRVDVYAKNATSPAVRVAFQQISFTVPDAEQFVFNAPPGTTVTEKTAADAKAEAEAHKAAREAGKESAKAQADLSTKVVGTGWTSVLVLKAPTGDKDAKGAKGAKPDADAAKQLEGLSGLLKDVSGSWGKGKLFSGSLFSALLTEDGRVLVGAVAPEKLYEAAAKK
jgi:outer membrane lipoprotein-sorting protein